MAIGQLNFNNEINNLLQIGDMLYFTDPPINGISGNPLPAGQVTQINNNQIQYTLQYPSQPIIGDYILFSKPIEVNESSLKGYYADVTFTNSSTKRVELFAVSSEIALSSK